MARHETKRNEIRGQLRAKLQKLSKRHKALIVRAGGRPFDITAVPDSLWVTIEEDVQRETEEAALAMFLFALLAGRRGLRKDDQRRLEADPKVPEFDGTIPQGFAQSRAREFAAKQSAQLAGDVVANARQRLGKLARKMEIEGFTQAEIDKRIGEAAGVGREEGIARTETNRALVGGEEEFKRRIEHDSKFTLVATWKHHAHRPPRHSNAPVDPCPICSPIEGLDEKDWPPMFQGGPPAHPFAIAI